MAFAKIAIADQDEDIRAMMEERIKLAFDELESLMLEN